MSKLTNERVVRDYALLVSESQHNGRTRVSRGFLEVIEDETRKAVATRVLHHDNKTGSRKTLV